MMKETTTPGMSRRQLLEAAGTAAAAIAAAGIASPVGAQDQTKDVVALQIAVKGPIPNIVLVPLEPPLTSGRPALGGESAILGQVAYVDDHEGRVGLDGNPVYATGRGVLTGANGDALSVEWVQLWAPPTATGVVAGTGAFIVTGGRGSYRGAGGNGSLRILFDPSANQLTFTFDGMIARPKA
jgi:hypothetical protein